jgi:hypothetical protein
MKTPLIEKLNIPDLMNAASHLALDGKLTISDNNLVYLDVDDAYIHRLYPLLQNQQIKKPDYFGEKSAGAHISVIYPEENKKINKSDLGQRHSFIIKDIIAAQIGLKTYNVLLVESASLLQLRRQYALPDMLCFKGYSIGFHITIGVKI